MRGIPQADERGEEFWVWGMHCWGGRRRQGSWDTGGPCGGAWQGKQEAQEGLRGNSRRNVSSRGACRIWARGDSAGQHGTGPGRRASLSPALGEGMVVMRLAGAVGVEKGDGVLGTWDPLVVGVGRRQLPILAWASVAGGASQGCQVLRRKHIWGDDNKRVLVAASRWQAEAQEERGRRG